ncbi:MAG: phage virion morphogenesis protein [Gammaproteobacteria bacterium]|nr:phage virion morphogenesis protein [Gammaproteobacteria bacterium]
MTHAAGAKQVEVGTNLVYGAIHQFGGRAGRGHSVNIDARPYLGLSAEDEDEVVGILRDFVEGFA